MASKKIAVLSRTGLDELIAVLIAEGYRVIGATVRDDAIVLARSVPAAAPSGWGVESAPGRYRLRRRGDEAVFGHSAGPQSWKQFLHPPRRQLWSSDGEGFPAGPRLARPVRVPRRARLRPGRDRDARPRSAAAAPDGSFAGGAGPVRGRGELHRARRGVLLRVDGHRAAAGPGYDLSLTEQIDSGDTASWPRPAPPTARASSPNDPSQRDRRRVERRGPTCSRAGRWAGRCQPSTSACCSGTPRVTALGRRGQRCLTCGNCTMVCPTCFCTTTEDSTDLTGDHAERWQRWASCFELDFSYLTAAACGSRGPAGTGSGSVTSSAPGTTSSAARAASAAAGASPGARSASTSPRITRLANLENPRRPERTTPVTSPEQLAGSRCSTG